MLQMSFDNLFRKGGRHMKIITSYNIPILQQARVTEDNPCVYGKVDDRLMAVCSACCLDALKYCVDVFLTEWDYLAAFPTTAKPGKPHRKRIADTLIHSTKDNQAKYPEFDRRFLNMPAGVRRALIADALGVVSSYRSNHDNWEKTPADERGEEPSIGYPTRYELTFYKSERGIDELPDGAIRLKLYNGTSWEWYRFRMKPSDARYIHALSQTRSMMSPVVIKKNGKFFLRFSFEEKQELVDDSNPLNYLVMAVDLGINAAASWCVMDKVGTVFGKGVIHLPNEEGRLNHAINRKRQYQQAGKKSHCVYRWGDQANERLSIETTRKLMEVAALYNVDCIVFEHLDTSGRKKGGRYRERIHLWRAKDVQKRVELQAHRNSMRISRVCAWGTSRYAYDGSGVTDRKSVYRWVHGEKKYNYSICTFQNGKIYNCDLSAAQNIGARFFLREYAKCEDCPKIPKTPQRTMKTLWDLVRVYKGCQAA